MPDYLLIGLAVALCTGLLLVLTKNWHGHFSLDHTHGVQKLMFLGSSCIYPKFAEQPMKEEALLTGLLEPTNEPYAIAKIAGIKLCESYNRQYGRDYRSVMPTNLYGPGDNFHPENSHVLPALLRRVHEAKVGNAPEVVIWGTGTPRREFLHSDDMADACFYLMEHYDGEITKVLAHIRVKRLLLSEKDRRGIGNAGIELEGLEGRSFEEVQYLQLARLVELTGCLAFLRLTVIQTQKRPDYCQ